MKTVEKTVVVNLEDVVNNFSNNIQVEGFNIVSKTHYIDIIKGKVIFNLVAVSEENKVVPIKPDWWCPACAKVVDNVMAGNVCPECREEVCVRTSELKNEK